MKKMLILLCMLILGITATPCLSKTITSYDKYGRKTGSYKQTSSGYVEYDKYNRTTGYYRQKNNSMVKYDKYGKITRSFKQQ